MLSLFLWPIVLKADSLCVEVSLHRWIMCVVFMHDADSRGRELLPDQNVLEEKLQNQYTTAQMENMSRK